MAEWRNGGTAGMAARRKEWQNSRMAEMATYVLFTVHTNDDNNDDTTSQRSSTGFLAEKKHQVSSSRHHHSKHHSR